MKNLIPRFSLILLTVGLVCSSPAWAVNREIVELQTQVQNLQTQMIVAQRINPFSRHSMVPRLAAWHIPTSSPLTIRSLSVGL